MKEKWIKWEPMGNLAHNYYVESITESLDGLRLVLFDSEKPADKILIRFAKSVDSFRRTTETFTYLTIDTLAEIYGTDFYEKWAFFKVENSEYLKWMSEQSYGISEERDFTHFCFLAVDSIVDVIANYEPEVFQIKSV